MQFLSLAASWLSGHSCLMEGNMKQKKKLSTGLFVLLMLLPSMFFLCVFTIYPLTRGVVMAFQNYNLFNLSDVHFVGLENFKELFDPSPLNNFPQIIKNTIKWVVVSVFFQLMLGMTLALLLRKPFNVNFAGEFH